MVKHSFSIAFLIALLAFVGSFLFRGNSALDLQLHDTYFVISHQHVSLFIALLFACFGLFYWLIDKFGVQLRTTISMFHLVGSALLLIAILIGSNAMNHSHTIGNMDSFRKLNTWMSLLMLFFIAIQVLLPTNIIISLFRRQH
jgi:cytochrome c oxidase subunit 1